jgi:hypothetical protein
MRYEVIETINGVERVVTRTRRENGAINERDRAVDAARENAQRHAGRTRGWVASGPTGRGNEWLVVEGGPEGEHWTFVTYRRIGGDPDPDIDPEPWLASIVALNGASI